MSEGPGWSVILPVKSLSTAKSRLGHPRPGELALAFLRDVLEALRDSPRVAEVVVVTGDAEVAAAAQDAGAAVVDDSDHPGINAAAAWGATARSSPGGTVVMVADLPCLTVEALALALDLAGAHQRAIVADADGSGTTMWIAGPGQPVETAFGPLSRQAHLALGAVDLVARHPESAAALAAARRDVDTPADLADALALGVGRHSRALLA